MLTIEIQFFPYNCYSLFQNKLIFQTDSKISHALQLKARSNNYKALVPNFGIN